MLTHLRQRWFLLTLLALLVVGMGWPSHARPLIAWLKTDWLVASVTFIMALTLETSAIWITLRRPGPALVGTVLNAGLCPPLGWLAGRLLPPELAVGVVVASVVPCTLATAAVWTRRAGGNDAVAFLVTMLTNLICFLVVPGWLWLLTGVHANIDYQAIVVGLVLLVVLPLLLAQLLRQWKPLGHWATGRKRAIGFLAQLGVLTMVLIGAVNCGERLAAMNHGSVLTAATTLEMIAAVAAVHLTVLLFGWQVSHTLSFPRVDAIAVAFAGSQKTLMVGVYVALAVSPLAILPMVAYHASQLFIDTLIADRWARHEDPI